MKNKKPKNKVQPIYLVSALRPDSSPLNHLRRFETEAEALERAKFIIELRRRNGKPTFNFFILKVVAHLEPQPGPIKLTKFKK